MKSSDDGKQKFKVAHNFFADFKYPKLRPDFNEEGMKKKIVKQINKCSIGFPYEPKMLEIQPFNEEKTKSYLNNLKTKPITHISESSLKPLSVRNCNQFKNVNTYAYKREDTNLQQCTDVQSTSLENQSKSYGEQLELSKNKTGSSERKKKSSKIRRWFAKKFS